MTTRFLLSVSLTATIAACGARTPLLVGGGGNDGGASPPGNDAAPVDAGTDSAAVETPDSTVETSDSGVGAPDSTVPPPDAMADAFEPDVIPPGDGSGPPRVVFFGTGGSYDEDSLQAFLAAYPATVTRMAMNASPVGAATLAPFDIVILDNVARSFDSSEAAALAAWVQGGGSVMAMSGFVNAPPSWQQPNTLLADLPVQFNGSFYLGNPAGGCPGDVTDFAMVPITSGLQVVPFCGGFGVTVTGVCDPVAFAQGGTVAATCEQGAGRVYLWGDDWVEYSSTWVAGVNTQQFWQDAMDWLTHRI